MSTRRKRQGFTFVETILAIMIVAAIASVTAKVLTSGLDIYALVMNRHDASQTARLAMERMVDELTMLGTLSMTYAGNTRLSFIDMDGHATNFRSSTVSRYGRTVPCIFRGDDFLAGNVVSLDFDYYRETGVSTTWPLQTRRINVEFTVEAPAGAGDVHFRTDVFPRNFMYDNFQ